MQTVGHLRYALLAGLVVMSAVWLWVGGRHDLIVGMVFACVISAVVGWFGSLAISRLSHNTPLAGLGIVAPSTLVFFLSVTAFPSLLVAPGLGVAVCAALVPTLWWHLRRSKAAVRRAHDDLVPSSGDRDFGVFTGTTPSLAPPSSRRDEPGVDAASSTSLFDPRGGDDPMKQWQRYRRTED